jgi:hypothetical protein
LKLYQVYWAVSFTTMTKRTNVDNVSRVLEILDEHLHEKDCQHNPQELFDEYNLAIA